MTTAATPPPSPLRLYELPAAFAAVEALIAEADGELPPELEAALDGLEGTLEAKAEGVAALIRQADLEASLFAAEVDRLRLRRQAAEGRADRLRAYLLRTLADLGRDRVQGARFTVRVQKNGRPSIRWTRPGEDLPDGFYRIRTELDGEAALAAYKAGTLPEGFEAVVGRHLRIV